ncbi:hypothetical protein N657DRAFT_638570 [Parathielavia appendiculata]|uniref:TAFII55 protein conserved region domain-containing protein n=1 Tax=Parathielavia appendiculata TaxID=2587402 RepID=A0AAN6U8M4_9PEZI|nr:hypothetical protein N657DRAFT_638570 [Parathielavia appendiculata]
MDPPQQPPPPKRLPSLKITSGASSFSAAAASSTITPNSSFQQTMSPAPLTPLQGPAKIKLVSKSQPSTPADSHPPALVPGPIINATADGVGKDPTAPKLTQTKAGRVSKPSAKKRIRDEAEEDEDLPLANKTDHRAKKTKITLRTPGPTRQPTLKLKPVGRIPQKPLGEGYDSEAEDREEDPVIEEQFIFRMMPGEHCEYLRQAVQNKQIGLPKAQGGADFQLKWLDEEGRRAVVTVKGQMYAAALLDLPTVTEGMKTWDKKSMVKSADICQILLVFAQVGSEEEAKTAPVPERADHYRWPHGLTPPMHDARNRRFRKRLSKLEIKNKEAEVERLLAADRDAISVRTEWIDSKQHAAADDEEEESEEDAEGEADDYFGDANAEQLGQEKEEEEEEFDDAALEAEFLEAPETPAIATPAAVTDALTPSAANAPTPQPQIEEEAGGAEEESAEDEEEDDEDEGDEDEEEEEEEDERGEDEGEAAIRNEIASLKKRLRDYEVQLAASKTNLMRRRLEANIRNIKSEIDLKKSAIGETEED